MVGNPGSSVAQKHGPQGAEKQYCGNKDSKNTFQPWNWVWKMNNHGW